MKLNKLVTSEQKMQWLIANSLGTDLDTSVQVSMKAVSSLDAGYGYFTSYNDRLRELLYESFYFRQCHLWSNLCSRDHIGRVKLYQVPKNSGYVCWNHE